VNPPEVTIMDEAPAAHGETPEPESLDLETLEGLAGGEEPEGMFNPYLNTSFN
jgi:hypothetical protein